MGINVLDESFLLTYIRRSKTDINENSTDTGNKSIFQCF